MYIHVFLSQSSVDGQLGWFHVFAIINSNAMNIGVHVFFFFPRFELLFFSDRSLGVGLLDHMVALFLVFKETSILFSTVAVQIYILINSTCSYSDN